MGHNINLGPELVVKLQTWMQEVWLPKLNLLFGEGHSQLRDIGIPEQHLNSIMITILVNAAIATVVSQENANKKDFMQECSNAWDNAVRLKDQPGMRSN